MAGLAEGGSKDTVAGRAIFARLPYEIMAATTAQESLAASPLLPEAANVEEVNEYLVRMRKERFACG